MLKHIGLTYNAMDGLTLVAGRFDDDGVAENDTMINMQWVV